VRCCAGLPNDLNVSDHSILVALAPAELGIGLTGRVVFDLMDGFEDVIQKIVQLNECFRTLIRAVPRRSLDPASLYAAPAA